MFAVVSAAALLSAGYLGKKLLPGAQLGDVDPASLVGALVSLAVAVISAWFGRRALVVTELAQAWNDADAAGVADRLAPEVRAMEIAARAALVGLGKRINVTFRVQLAHSAALPGSAGALATVGDYYRGVRPGRLIISGVGGAGKTVLALELMLDLLKSRSDGEPVPVRVTAATWPTGFSVEEWLVRHLVDTYALRHAAARSLLNAGLVLPVVDGLDEMADNAPELDSRPAALLRALDEFHDSEGLAPLVLTCRSEQLGALADIGVRLRDSATIEIVGLSAAEAQLYLQTSVDDPARWQPVLAKLLFEPTGLLSTALGTPWRLSLVRQVYERDTQGGYQHDPLELVNTTWSGPDHLRDHLLSLLIPIATGDAETARYHPDQVHRWLTTLARDYLGRHGGTQVGGVAISGTDLVPHQLWPLAGVRFVRGVTVALAWLLLFGALCVELLRETPRQSPTYIVTVAGGAGFLLALLMLLAALTKAEPNRFVWTFATKVVGRTKLRRLKVASLTLFAGVSTLGYMLVVLADRSTAGWLLWAIPLCSVAFVTITFARDDASISARNPRELLAADARFMVLLAMVTGVLMAVLTQVAPAPPVSVDDFGLFIGAAIGVVIAWTIAPASIYYLAMLLGTRRWSRHPLPWELGDFLEWSCERGLLRSAGVAYQFRHREIQDFLASRDNPNVP